MFLREVSENTKLEPQCSVPCHIERVAGSKHRAGRGVKHGWPVVDALAQDPRSGDRSDERQRDGEGSECGREQVHVGQRFRVV